MLAMSSSQVIHRAFMALYTVHNGKLGLLAAISVVSYAYSGLVLRLLDHVGWSLVASPQIAVAIVAVCLLPQARARWSLASAAQDEKKAATASGCDEQACSGRRSLDGSSNVRSTHLQSFRLAQPPFADLSYGMASSYDCSNISSRRRRLPRISIELAPLPRVSLEFQRSCKSHKRSSNISSSRASLGTLSPYSNSLQDSSMRWQPSMTRISSGQDLQLLGCQRSGSYSGFDTTGSGEVTATDTSSSGEAIAVGEATESLGHSVLPVEVQHLSEVITDTHLLQFGAMIGESSSRAALVAQEAGGPVNHPDSFYGSADTNEFLQSWELLVSESNSSVLYWAWRRPLRKGLYMYMTRSVFLDATPAELRAFMNDDVYRVVWDSSMHLLRPVQPQGCSGFAAGSNAAVEAMAAAVAARTMGCGTPCSAAMPSPFVNAAVATSSSSHCSRSDTQDTCNSSSPEVLPHENGILQALVQFPKPMASRSYMYARRVWHRPSDGGCYCLSKSCYYADPPALPGRAVAVEDYVSGCVVRTPAEQVLPVGYAGAAAEVTLVYFEDSHVRPGLTNMGVKKGLWPLVQRTEKALRVYQAGAAANVHLQSLAAPSTQRETLHRSMSMPSPGSMSKQDSSATFAVSSSSCGGVAPTQAAVEEEAASAHSEGQDTLAKPSGDVTTSSSSNNSTGPAGDGPAAVDADQAVQQTAEAGSAKQQQHLDSSAGCPAAQELISSRFSHHSDCSSSKSASGCKKGNSWQSWLSDVTAAVGNALKGSAQFLATAAVAIWQSQTRLALLVPNLEWRLLQWCVQRVRAPAQLLLLPPPANSVGNSSSSSSDALRKVNSHPIGDWAHPGLLRKILQDSKSSREPSLLRVASHPLPAEDLDLAAAAAVGDGAVLDVHNAPCCCHAHMQFAQQELSVNGDWSSAAYGPMRGHRRQRAASPSPAAAVGDDSTSICSSIGVASSSCCSSHRVGSSYSTSATASSCVSSSSRCCCHGGNCSTAGSSSRLSSGHGSTRISGGGRRQRRVVVRLMQAAGVRIVHKLISALEQPAAAATQD